MVVVVNSSSSSSELTISLFFRSSLFFEDNEYNDDNDINDNEQNSSLLFWFFLFLFPVVLFSLSYFFRINLATLSF